MGVIAGWKKLLGADWDKAYAASNTIFSPARTMWLFSVLAQFFGPDAINSRLMLIETISFTTKPEDMLEALTRSLPTLSGRHVFGKLLPDGLRADGRGWAQGNHRARARNTA